MAKIVPDVGRVEPRVGQCITCGSKSPLRADEIQDKLKAVQRLCRSCGSLKSHITEWFRPQ